MKRVSSRSLLAVAIEMWCRRLHCTVVGHDRAASEPLVLNRSQTSGAKLGFLLLSSDLLERPAAFCGLFVPILSPTVRIDQIDSTNVDDRQRRTLTGDPAASSASPG